MPTPRKPEFKDYADFVSKLGDDQWKEYIWTQLQFIQKERLRLREKAKKQRDKLKTVVAITDPQPSEVSS